MRNIGKFNVSNQCLAGGIQVGPGEWTFRPSTFCTLALDHDMVQTLREEIDRSDVDYENDEVPIVKHFREILDLTPGGENESIGFSGLFNASILTCEDQDGTKEVVFINMNRDCRNDLADFIEDLQSPVKAIGALIAGLRNPGGKMAPQQRAQFHRQVASMSFGELVNMVISRDHRLED